MPELRARIAAIAERRMVSDVGTSSAPRCASARFRQIQKHFEEEASDVQKTHAYNRYRRPDDRRRDGADDVTVIGSWQCRRSCGDAAEA
jgi:hypothetical protein